MKKRDRECRLLLILLSWWLVLFPEMVFCSGMCTAYACGDTSKSAGTIDGSGGAGQICMDGEALRELLFRAEPEQIKYKSFLWEKLSKESSTEE